MELYDDSSTCYVYFHVGMYGYMNVCMCMFMYNYNYVHALEFYRSFMYLSNIHAEAELASCWNHDSGTVSKN